MDLYAVVTPGIWITFDGHLKGASYTAPVFVQYGQSVNEATAPNKIADPTCDGWTFAGWFEDELNNHAFDFEAKIPAGSHNKTVYARWNKNQTADYTVNVWLQNATDTSKYDFYQAYTVENATVDQPAINNGVTVSGTPGADNSYVKVGDTVVAPDFNENTMSAAKLPFHLKSYTDVVVTSDGKTVMNVYYDRTEYTLTFATGYTQQWHQISTASDPSSVPGVTKDTSGWLFPTTTYYYTDANGKHELQDRGRGWSYDWGYYENVPSDAKTIKALYGQNIADKFPIAGYEDASWTAQNSKYFSDNYQMSILSVMPAEDTTFQAFTYSGRHSYPFKFYFQTLPGVAGNASYDGMTFDGGTKYTIKSDSLQSTKNEDFIEFEGFDRYASSPAYESDGTVSLRSDTGISFYYTRKSYQIVYNDGATYAAPGLNDTDRIAELPHNQIADPASVLYEQNTKDFGNVTPTKEGYVFAGWYDDTACTQKHDFNVKMPSHNVTVYAKWIQTKYEVTIHDGSVSGNEYTGGYTNPATVGYDGTVTEPNLNHGTDAAEWEFVGWYVDEACTQPFTFDYHLNKTTESTLPIDSQTPTSSNNYVAGKMDLYAKWRHVLVGADGITVVYDALDGNTVNGAQTYTDGQKYQEGSTASATSAATYNKDETQKFQYWDLQRWDAASNQYVSTGTHVYPGDTFDVKYEYARPEANEDNTADNPSYTYTVMLKAVYADATPEKTTVIFDANDGTFGTNDKDTKSYDVNTQITVPGDPTREGYDFIGWSGTKKDAWTVDEYNAATNTLYKLDADGNQIKADANGKAIEFAADNLDGLAWKNADGTNVLYACWKKKPVTLTIQKELVGAQADLTKGYTFQVSVTRDGNTVGNTYTTDKLYDRQGENGKGQSVTLGGKDKTGIELLWGDTVTVTETDNTGYTTTYTTQLGTDAASSQQTGASVSGFQLNGNGKVVFTNEKISTPVTAVLTHDAPKVLGVLAIAGLAIAGGFALVQRNTLQAASAGAHSAGHRATKRTDSNGNSRHMRGNGRRW